MIAVAVTLLSIDTMTLLVSMMSYTFWFASPENRRAELFHCYLPLWLVVRDKEVLQGYYYGDAFFGNLTYCGYGYHHSFGSGYLWRCWSSPVSALLSS